MDALASELDAVGLTIGPLESAGVLLLTLLLMLIISFTYQRTHTGALYTQGFVQSLIMVGMVASLVLQIVGDSIAAAFAIFGAFSIIRYRSAVPETRDVAFIFLAIAVGLAAGGGLFELAAVATVIICAVIAVLTRFDLFAPQRVSHTLRVRVTNDVDYAAAFRPAFEAHFDRARMQRLESVQGGMLTEITYNVRMKPGAEVRDLVSQLQQITGTNRVLLLATGPTIDDNDD